MTTGGTTFLLLFNPPLSSTSSSLSYLKANIFSESKDISYRSSWVKSSVIYCWKSGIPLCLLTKCFKNCSQTKQSPTRNSINKATNCFKSNTDKKKSLCYLLFSFQTCICWHFYSIFLFLLFHSVLPFYTSQFQIY